MKSCNQCFFFFFFFYFLIKKFGEIQQKKERRKLVKFIHEKKEISKNFPISLSRSGKISPEKNHCL